MNPQFLPAATQRIHQQREQLSLIDRIARKLKKVCRYSARQSKHWLARGVYSLPFLTRHDPRRKIIKCIDHCRIIDDFPTGGLESIPEDWYLRMRPRETIQRQSSICLDESEAARFRAGTAHYQHGDRCEIPEVFLACFHDARIEGRDFLFLTRENRIVLESALQDQGILEGNGILDRLIPPIAKKLSGSYGLLAHPWAGGYYHWVIEVLPKLSLIERFDDLKSLPLIVPHHLKAFQRDSLSIAGVSADRMVHLDEGCWQVDSLCFPEMLAPSGNPSPRAVSWLRKTFLDEGTPDSSSSKRKLYVSRGDAAGRKILNEEQIIEFLAGKGFAIICPGDYSFTRQIAIFRDVSIVVAPHGAGLTNMVFAPADTILIELFGDNYVNGCYWALANIRRQKHAFVTGSSQGMDYSISLDELEVLLAKVCGI